MNGHQDGLVLDRGFPFQIEEVTLEAGDNADAAFHWHSFLEITCILEGSGCYYVSDRAYEVAPGDIVLFNSAELHGWQVFQRDLLHHKHFQALKHFAQKHKSCRYQKF